jgi:pyruvate dehydrogenase E1 component beta subunit
MESVRKTHKAIYVEEGRPFCGVGAQIAYMIQQQCFDDLDAPVLRVTSLDAPAIYSPPLEKIQLPAAEDVIEKVLSIC